NFSMSRAGGDIFQYSFVPVALGTYAFTVTAADGVGNIRTEIGAFSVRDGTPPGVSAVRVLPDPVELGQATSIEANVSDVGGVSSVRVEIRDPSGAAMGSFTMTLGTGTTYRYAFTPTMLGAYSF